MSPVTPISGSGLYGLPPSVNTTTDISAFTSDEIRALTVKQVAALTTAQVASIATDAVAGLTGRQMVALGTRGASAHINS